MASDRVLKTAGDVIEALGGYSTVAKTYKVAYQATHNWANYRDHIPSRLFCAMNEALAKKNLSASPALWGMWPHTSKRSA